jgi:hypothetical protein
MTARCARQQKHVLVCGSSSCKQGLWLHVCSCVVFVCVVLVSGCVEEVVQESRDDSKVRLPWVLGVRAEWRGGERGHTGEQIRRQGVCQFMD